MNAGRPDRRRGESNEADLDVRRRRVHPGRAVPTAQESVGVGVADDLDPGRLEAERQQLAREERAVAVGPLTADELTAGDDDDRARARQRVS